MKIEVVLDDGVGLFWMWVVLEMPCGVGQRSGSGGKVNAEFLEISRKCRGAIVEVELAGPPKIRRIRRSVGAGV